MDFNRQLVFDPKIDIIGKEVPIAAMEKTGDILQGRYDAAKDTETKTMALTKKLAASSNPVDRETAAQIMAHYGDKMKQRTDVGDYQNMKWQTQQDAMDAAGLYEGLSNRNKQIEKDLEGISKSTDYITDASRKEAVRMYNQKLKSASFDPSNGVLTGLQVDPFKEAKDVATEKELLAVIPHMKFSSNGTTNASIGFIDANGKKVDGYVPGGHMVKFTDSGEHQRLTKEDIAGEATKYLRANTDFNAMIQRNLDRKGITDPKEREIVGEQMFHQEADKAISSVSTMFDVNNNQTGHDYSKFRKKRNGFWNWSS
jgi:hypothetical protein